MPWSTELVVEAAGGVGEEVERAGSSGRRRAAGSRPCRAPTWWRAPARSAAATESRRSGRRRGRPTRRRWRRGTDPRRARARSRRSCGPRRRWPPTVTEAVVAAQHQARVVAAVDQARGGVHDRVVDLGRSRRWRRRSAASDGRHPRSPRRRGTELSSSLMSAGPPPRCARVLSLSRRRAILTRSPAGAAIPGARRGGTDPPCEPTLPVRARSRRESRVRHTRTRSRRYVARRAMRSVQVVSLDGPAGVRGGRGARARPGGRRGAGRGARASGSRFPDLLLSQGRVPAQARAAVHARRRLRRRGRGGARGLRVRRRRPGGRRACRTAAAADLVAGAPRRRCSRCPTRCASRRAPRCR